MVTILTRRKKAVQAIHKKGFSQNSSFRPRVVSIREIYISHALLMLKNAFPSSSYHRTKECWMRRPLISTVDWRLLGFTRLQNLWLLLLLFLLMLIMIAAKFIVYSPKFKLIFIKQPEHGRWKYFENFHRRRRSKYERQELNLIDISKIDFRFETAQ